MKEYIIAHGDVDTAVKELIRCKDCDWWEKQKKSAQGRCALHGMYPTGAYYCASARRKGEQE